MSALVCVEGLTKRFRARRHLLDNRDQPDVLAVDDVSLAIPEGATLACVGASGSGKSTLGRLILRLIEPDAGRIHYRGVNLASLAAAEMRLLRRELQLVFQDPMLSLNPRRTIGENLARPLWNFGAGRGAAAARVAELLELVGLDPRQAHRYPSELSGGQCQRVAIARALALEPRFVVLDEPVSALDVSVQAQILNLLLELQARLRLTYLFVTHDLKLVRYMADQVVVMHHGRIVEAGASSEVWRAPQHFYTRSLIRSVLRLDATPDWEALAGESSDADAPPTPSATTVSHRGGTWQ
jgi:ABC-type glutathione transport system ATPase component